MANTTPSIYMNMPIPVPGVDPGPDWANNYNACLTILDGHTHTGSGGTGQQLTQASLNLTPQGSAQDSLNFNSGNAYGIRSLRLVNQSVPLALATDLGCVYESGGDLYYNNSGGTAVQITTGSSVNAGAGSITGLPSGTASASYSGGKFTFQSATSTSAAMDNGPVTIRQALASANGITLQSPNSLAANYNLVLPTGLPGSASLLSLDASGNIGTGPINATLTTLTTTGNLTVGGTHLNIGNQLLADSSNYLTVVNSASNGIALGNATTGPKLTDDGSGNFIISGSVQIASSGPLISKTTDNSVTELGVNKAIKININSSGCAIADYSPNTLYAIRPGNTSGRAMVVSANPSTNGLMIVRGAISWNGSSWVTVLGEGFAPSGSNGGPIIAFTDVFNDSPSVTGTFSSDLQLGQPGIATVISSSASTAVFAIKDASGADWATVGKLYFIIIGIRNNSI